MGKIRVKSLGANLDEIEGARLLDKRGGGFKKKSSSAKASEGREQKEKLEKKKQARLQTLEPARQSPNGSSQMADGRSDSGQAKKAVKVPGMKGGERVVAVGPTEEELEALEEKKEIKEEPKKKVKVKKDNKEPHSQKYQSLLGLVDRAKIYPLTEALELLEKLQRKSFDETVELHINALTGVSGNVTLPHGTGKKTRVAVANDALIAEIEKGIINFDILLATPDLMPKLARVAKVLGPRGLMPNPKNGTITQNPEELVKKYEGGQVSFKTEAKSPIMHLTVGKMSFGAKKLTENIEVALDAIKKSNIVNATLKSTMSPGIKITL